MAYAPIALFTYNRPDHTQKAVESLLHNSEANESELYIFSDGAKNEKAETGVRANREYIHTITGFKSITITEREKNWGLANSLIAGITELTEKFGRVIVVEDDLILSPYFLKFMNDGLEKYEKEDKVAAISAYVPAKDTTLPNTYFLRYFHCWGWATWKRSWDLLNTDIRYLLRQMRFQKNAFDVGGSAGAYGNLLCQKYGIVDSWWVRLYASFFLSNKLTLYPNMSLATNGGLDGSGTHSGNGNGNDKTMYYSMQPIEVDTIPIQESLLAFKSFKREFDSRLQDIPRYKIIYGNIKSFIRRVLYIDCR